MLIIEFAPSFRLCGVIHVLFYTLHYFLNDRDTIESEEFGIPAQMSHETAQTVLELVRYFSKQRAILNKVHVVITGCSLL